MLFSYAWVAAFDEEPRTCLHFNVAGDGMDQFHAIFWMGLETMFYSVVPGHAFGPFLRA